MLKLLANSKVITESKTKGFKFIIEYDGTKYSFVHVCLFK